jgi:hypothetical protein
MLVDSMTPYHMWYKVKLLIAHVCSFGSSAYVHTLKELRRKLDKKSKYCIFMDYNEMSKAYYLWDNQSRRIVESKDVLFNELGMKGGDRCETSLDNTIMHLNDIVLDAPIQGMQYPIEREGAHKMGDV